MPRQVSLELLAMKNQQIEALEQLVKRYHALLDTWDLEIADHVPYTIAQAAEEEKDDLQREAERLLDK